MTTMLDLFAVIVWPLLLTAAAWALAVYALKEPDETTQTVEALTRSHDNKQRTSARE